MVMTSMNVPPQLQRLIYGTLVVAGAAVTGTLWYQRTGPQKVKVVDYIEIYQSCLEKCMATEDADFYIGYAWQPTVRTNLVMSWTNDSRGYWIYPTNGVSSTGTVAALRTNYWIAGGYTAQDVWTNNLNHRYRIALPDTATRELTGADGRYIWNAYSNLTVAGFANSNYNGTYRSMTNGTTIELAGWALASLPLHYLDIMDKIGQSVDVPCHIYSNATHLNYFLLDFGPLDSAGKANDPYYDLHSSIIWGKRGSSWARRAFTYRGDSPLNGPWFLNADSAPVAGVTVTGSGFSSNILIDAYCRWYVGKKTEHAVYDGSEDWHSWDDIAPPYTDPRYWAPTRHALGAEVHKAQLDDIAGTILSLVDAYAVGGAYPSDYEVGSRYIRTNSAVAGEFVGFTDLQDFYDLSTQYTAKAVCSWAGVPLVWTNSAIPSTGDVTRLAKLLQEFQWTRRGRTFGLNIPYIYDHQWYLPGQCTGITVSVTNYWYGTGKSTSSWADAKAIATTNFAPYAAIADVGPFQFTQGYYIKYNSTWQEWEAEIHACQVELAYPGACTSITHEADFYLMGADPYFGIGTNTWDANGTGILSNEYKRLGSVTNNLAYPYITVGATNMPNWCVDPKPAAPVEDQAYYLRQGYGAAVPEIVMKWHWQYNTNGL